MTGPQTDNLYAPPHNHSCLPKVGATPAIYAEELSHTPAEVTHQGGTYGGKKTSVQLVREACWNFTCGNQCTSVIVRAAAIYHCTVGSPCPQWSTLSMLCTIQRGTYARTIVSNGARQITLCMGTIHQPCTALNTKALAQAPLKPLPSSMYFACHMSILLSDPGNTRGLALPQDWIVNDEEIIPAYDGVHADQDRRQLDTQRCPILLTGTGARYSLPRLVCPADQQEMPAQTGTEHVQALLEALIADDRPKILLCISYFLGQESVQSVQNRLETLTLKDLEPHAIARLAAGWKVMEKHQQLCLAFCLDDTEQATTPCHPQALQSCSTHLFASLLMPSQVRKYPDRRARGGNCQAELKDGKRPCLLMPHHDPAKRPEPKTKGRLPAMHCPHCARLNRHIQSILPPITMRPSISPGASMVVSAAGSSAQLLSSAEAHSASNVIGVIVSPSSNNRDPFQHKGCTVWASLCAIQYHNGHPPRCQSIIKHLRPRPPTVLQSLNPYRLTLAMGHSKCSKKRQGQRPGKEQRAAAREAAELEALAVNTSTQEHHEEEEHPDAANLEQGQQSEMWDEEGPWEDATNPEQQTWRPSVHQSQEDPQHAPSHDMASLSSLPASSSCSSHNQQAWQPGEGLQLQRVPQRDAEPTLDDDTNAMLTGTPARLVQQERNPAPCTPDMSPVSPPDEPGDPEPMPATPMSAHGIAQLNLPQHDCPDSMATPEAPPITAASSAPSLNEDPPHHYTLQQLWNMEDVHSSGPQSTSRDRSDSPELLRASSSSSRKRHHRPERSETSDEEELIPDDQMQTQRLDALRRNLQRAFGRKTLSILGAVLLMLAIKPVCSGSIVGFAAQPCRHSGPGLNSLWTLTDHRGQHSIKMPPPISMQWNRPVANAGATKYHGGDGHIGTTPTIYFQIASKITPKTTERAEPGPKSWRRAAAGTRLSTIMFLCCLSDTLAGPVKPRVSPEAATGEGAPSSSLSATYRSGGAKHGGQSPIILHAEQIVRKRSLQKAWVQAHRQTATRYRGRTLLAPEHPTFSEHAAQAPPHRHRSAEAFPEPTRRRLTVMTYNCGGLAQGLYHELLEWLRAPDGAAHAPDIVFIQETHWSKPSDWDTHDWYVQASCLSAHQAGLLTLVSKRRFPQAAIRTNAAVEGRLMCTRLEAAGVVYTLLNVYQKALDNKPGTQAERDAVWDALRLPQAT